MSDLQEYQDNVQAFVSFNPENRNSKDFFQPINFKDRLLSLFFGLDKLTLSVQLFEDRVRGIDVSHWNTEPDWVALRASGIEFVILKATEGNWYTDTVALGWYQRAIDAGLVVFFYHFFRGNRSGDEQALYFLDKTKVIREQIPTRLFGDFETGDGVSISTRQNRAYQFLNRVQIETGDLPGMYSSAYLWQSLFGNPAWGYSYIGWTAHWSAAENPLIPGGWDSTKTLFWQNGIYPSHSWIPPMSGTVGSIDHNYFFGSRKELEQFAGYEVTPIPPVVEEPIGIIRVTANVLNVRQEPKVGSADWGDIVNPSQWYVFELKTDGNYEWARIGKNAWCAIKYQSGSTVYTYAVWVQ